MSPEDFQIFSLAFAQRSKSLRESAETLRLASSEEASLDIAEDVRAEGTFLRHFLEYEAAIEVVFLHYVTGGLAIGGWAPKSIIATSNTDAVKRLIKGGAQFLSWAKPSSVRDYAERCFEDGKPFVDIFLSRASTLSDCEKIRNRIAHPSIEAQIGFAEVQRNLFRTERPFQMTPGQALRVRAGRGSTHLVRLASVMEDVVLGLCNHA